MQLGAASPTGQDEPQERGDEGHEGGERAGEARVLEVGGVDHDQRLAQP